MRTHEEYVGFVEAEITDSQLEQQYGYEIYVASLLANLAVLERHKPISDWDDILICGRCAALCHSESGLNCHNPDGAFPCLDYLDVTTHLDKVMGVEG